MARERERARQGQDLVLKKMKENPRISISRLSSECGISLKATRVIIDKLKSNGTLHRVGADFGGYWEISDAES